MTSNGSNDTADRLRSASKKYVPRDSADAAILALDEHWIQAHVVGPRVLEMGCSDGTSTRLLLDHCEKLDVVEGAELYCDMLNDEIQDSRLTVINNLYEEFEPSVKYDDVVLARSLDYVDDPVAVLQRVRGWIRDSGRLHIVVQNAASVHRRIGVALGLLSQIDELNNLSRAVGHQRVYTVESLHRDVDASGFESVEMSGFLLKPFDFDSMNRMDSDLSSELIPALFEVGRQVPIDLCSQIYAKCVPRQG